MTYKTIKSQAQAVYEEKKSSFIGAVKRVESEDEAKDFINEVRQSNREARHNVYAYVIGENLGIQRYNDDGEPQGTGGIPVLEVIKRNEVTDTVIVVTRYFGGVLLGASGLCRAYSKAAAMAVKEAGTIVKVKAISMKVKVDYDSLGKIEYYFNQQGWQIVNIEYSEVVTIKILCESDKYEIIKNTLTDITKNKLTIFEQKEGIYFKEGDLILDS